MELSQKSKDKQIEYWTRNLRLYCSVLRSVKGFPSCPRDSFALLDKGKTDFLRSDDQLKYLPRRLRGRQQERWELEGMSGEKKRIEE